MIGQEGQRAASTTLFSRPFLNLPIGGPGVREDKSNQHAWPSSSNSAADKADPKSLDLAERAISAAAAAVVSAIIVNPLDVVKTRLQAQAAAEPYQYARKQAGPWNRDVHEKCPRVCPRGGVSGTTPLCPPACFRYNGTFDVFYKIIRQEGVRRLWRGTNAGLVLAVPTVGIYLPSYDIFRDFFENYSRRRFPQFYPYAPLLAGTIARSMACIICSPIELARVRMQAQREIQSGIKPPGIWKTLVEVLSTFKGEPLQAFRALWTGAGAQLARDVPFSAICWITLEPIRRELLEWIDSGTGVAAVLGANFTAGVIAGSVAAAATCPLDVAKTRRQIERDPEKVLRTNTRKVLAQVWREGGLPGLFMGVVPRVARAGPSVGIVVSFYEVVKYALHQTHAHS